MAFVVLALFAFALRILPILGNNFSFMYDNAKDSLVLLEMFQRHKPALVGTVSSINGLFQGPAWYYVAFPFNVLGNFHPFASVAAVLALLALSLWICWKYLGKLEAVLYAISAGVIAAQQTAWAPYMTLFLTLPAIALFTTFQHKKPSPTKTLVGLALCSSLLFHVEIAFAVVFLPLLLLSLLAVRPKITGKQIMIAFAFFLIPMIPSFIFDLRHNFLQTRAVVNFVTHYAAESHQISPNARGLLRIQEVLSYTFNNANMAMLPYPNRYLAIIALGTIALYLKTLFAKKKQWRNDAFLLILLLGTPLMYLILPMKPFYFVGLAPAWIVLLARALRTAFPSWIPLVGIAFLLLVIPWLRRSTATYARLAQTDSFLLAPKLTAVQQAYTFAEGKPFTSYQYVPEVYDYTYQYLYLFQHRLGKTLPVEFSYAPGESAYIPQKHVDASDKKPEVVILIVERDEHQDRVDAWWNHVTQNLNIIEKKQINDAITVYKTVPKSKGVTE